MQELRTAKFPTVLYDNYIKDNPYIASVGCDNQEGFDLAVRHLVKLGHKKIGLISGPLDSYILKARYHAYFNALEKYGLEISEDYIGLGYYVSESTRKYIPKLLEQGVTAILFPTMCAPSLPLRNLMTGISVSPTISALWALTTCQ